MEVAELLAHIEKRVLLREKLRSYVRKISPQPSRFRVEMAESSKSIVTEATQGGIRDNGSRKKDR